MSDQQLFESLPTKFLDGVFLAPHNFSDPENPLHGEMVNFQLKTDLYNDVFRKIEQLEFGLFSGQEGYLKLEDIKECDTATTYLERLKDQRNINKEQDDLIRCEEWNINNSGKKSSIYKVKYFQSRTDRFYNMIYPPSALKYLRLYIKRQI